MQDHVWVEPPEKEQFLTITEGSWDTRSPLFTSTGWAVEGMALAHMAIFSCSTPLSGQVDLHTHT